VIEVVLAKGHNKVGAPLHLGAETDPVSETLYFLVFIILDDGQSTEA
jgi:hypothetical protein